MSPLKRLLFMMSHKWRACSQAKDDDDDDDSGGSDDDDDDDSGGSDDDDDDDSGGSDDDGDDDDNDVNDDDDHHHDDHQDNDFHDDDDDDDDDDNEMMIRALRVSWVNCGKVGGLYCSMVQNCNVMKIKQNITFLIKNFNQLFLLLRKLIRSNHINFV